MSRLSAEEHRRAVAQRHEAETQQRWRFWVRLAAVTGIALWLLGNVFVHQSVEQSAGWVFAAWLILIGFAIMLLVTPVALIDWWRDGRDLITYIRLLWQERRQDGDR